MNKRDLQHMFWQLINFIVQARVNVLWLKSGSANIVYTS